MPLRTERAGIKGSGMRVGLAATGVDMVDESSRVSGEEGQQATQNEIF